MTSRMKNVAMVMPDALQALLAFGKTAENGSVPVKTIQLVQLRASQINGCSVCVDLHSRELEHAGERPAHIFAVSAWRESTYFDEAERAALALAEAATRLADRADAVPDEVWDEAARHYDEAQLAALVIAIATINAFNRVNAMTRQPSGEWIAQFVEASARAV
jgi:AhpD family alkylhydroperoxidase